MSIALQLGTTLGFKSNKEFCKFGYNDEEKLSYSL